MNKFIPKLLARLGEDLRKAGYLVGIGFIGIIVSNDQISVLEGFALLMWGFYIWGFGHFCIYLSDKLTDKHQQGDL